MSLLETCFSSLKGKRQKLIEKISHFVQSVMYIRKNVCFHSLLFFDSKYVFLIDPREQEVSNPPREWNTDATSWSLFPMASDYGFRRSRVSIGGI